MKWKPKIEVFGLADEVRIALRLLQNAPFRSLRLSAQSRRQALMSTRLRRINPRNIQHIPACPVQCEAYFTGVVEIIAFPSGP